MEGSPSWINEERVSTECEKDKKVREVKGELGIEREKEREIRRRKGDRDRASQIKERVRFPTKGERGKRLGWES